MAVFKRPPRVDPRTVEEHLNMLDQHLADMSERLADPSKRRAQETEEGLRRTIDAWLEARHRITNPITPMEGTKR